MDLRAPVPATPPPSGPGPHTTGDISAAAWSRPGSGAGIVVGFSLLLALMILVTLIGLSYMAATKQQLQDIVGQRLIKLKLSTEMRLAARERTASLQRMALLTDPFERDAQWMNFNRQAGTFMRARAQMTAMALSDAELELLQQQSRFTGVAVPLQNRVVDLIKAGNVTAARPLLIEQAIPAQDQVLEQLRTLQELQEEAAAVALAQAELAYEVARRWMIGLSGSILALGVLIATVVVYRNRMVTGALQRAGGELQFRATHDDLTGLMNRREFDRRLEQVLHDARKQGGQHVICYIDLDLFKPINDAVGHVAGDELLRQLAEKLRASVRPTDLAARVGGDEFVIVFVHCQLTDGLSRANALRHAVRDLRFVWGARSFNISASIGVAQIEADSGTLTDVLSLADDACRRAKDQGRNRTQIGGDLKNRLARRDDIDWVNRIRDATMHEQWVLYAQTIQPVIPSTPAAPLHFEILLRLREPDGRLIEPGAFLPVAERYHLMPELDRAVVRASLAALAGHRKTSGAPVLVNINLSGQSLYDPEFLEFIVNAIHRADVPPAWLCFEITETAAVANLSSALELVASLRAEGCQFALDDFGSGASSFGYLKNLKVDFIKIDGVFVKDIADDLIDRAMVKSINEMAHVISARTIGEYVETPAIFEQLQKIQVDFVQGYGISVPQPLDLVLRNASTHGGPPARVHPSPWAVAKSS